MQEKANELLIVQSLNVIEKRGKKTAITRNNVLVTQDNPQTSTSIVFFFFYVRAISSARKKLQWKTGSLWINRDLLF